MALNQLYSLFEFWDSDFDKTIFLDEVEKIGLSLNEHDTETEFYRTTSLIERYAVALGLSSDIIYREDGSEVKGDFFNFALKEKEILSEEANRGELFVESLDKAVIQKYHLQRNIFKTKEQRDLFLKVKNMLFTELNFDFKSLGINKNQSNNEVSLAGNIRFKLPYSPQDDDIPKIFEFIKFFDPDNQDIKAFTLGYIVDKDYYSDYWLENFQGLLEVQHDVLTKVLKDVIKNIEDAILNIFTFLNKLLDDFYINIKEKYRMRSTYEENFIRYNMFLFDSSGKNICHAASLKFETEGSDIGVYKNYRYQFARN